MSTIEISLQFLAVLLAIANLWFWRVPEAKRATLDRLLFWVVAFGLVSFTAFRPLGVGVDDGGYTSWVWSRSCPSLTCGQWWQGSRDQAWYSLVGLLKSVYPHPEVALWLAGLGLVIKLWVIERLCRHRSLALLFYLGCFYVIHDITALRVSLAISVYLLGFYGLVQSRLRWGAGILAVNGFFHQQAFAAPLLLVGRWLPLTSRRVQLWLLLPLVLLVMGVYPGDGILHWFMSFDSGHNVIAVLFHGYENKKIAGAYEHTRLWPVVAPPTLFLAAWLIPDLSDRHRILFQYTATSLIIAALFLWGYAVVPEVQLRFWHFFLVTIVFVIGNVQLTCWKLIAILAVSTVYLLKYTVMHDLLLDQRQVHWDTPVGGQIVLQTPAIACGEGCGFNVRQGTTAKLKALPDKGYRFAGWSGECAGAEPLCAVTVEDDVSVGAQFVKTVSVSAQWTGNGTLTATGQPPCKSKCDWHPDVGAELAMTAIPAEGWRFAGWGGACTGGEVSCVLKAETDQAVTAAFVQVFPVHLVIGPGGSVEGQPEGRGDCAAGCDWVVDAGTELSLQAVPEAVHRFVGWTGPCEGQGARCSVKAKAAVTAEAKFVQLIPVHLVTGQGGTVEGLPGAVGDCTVGCDLSVDAGVELTLQAVPAPSHRFGGWSGGCDGQAARCVVKPEAVVTVGAKFVPIHTVDSAAAELGRVMAETPTASSAAPGPWVVDEGAVLPLTPVAKPGARFDHWTAGCVGTGLCPLTVTQDLTISAAFRALPAYPLRVTVRGQGQVSSEPAGLACGPGSVGSCRGVFSDVTLRAEPAAGFVFRRWVGCAAGSHPVCATILSRASTLAAEFVPVPRHEVKLAVTGPGAVQGLVDGAPCTKGARTCRALVVQGGEVTLTAVPEEEHFFVGWSGACVGREVTCKVPVSGAVGVGAEFQ